MADVEKSIKEDRKSHDNSAKDLKASKKELEEVNIFVLLFGL